VLVAFRIVWGLIGTRYARFSSFVRSPTAVFSYIAGLARGRHTPYVGHNPAGGVAIVMLLVSSTAVILTGWAAYNEVDGGQMESIRQHIPC
jgi:cytochrome b